MVSHDTEVGYNMADVLQIQRFLRDVRHADIIDFVPTDKNRLTRLSIGLTAHDQDDIVRNLRIVDYHSGPSMDKDPTRNGLVWVFKHQFEEHMLYIKLKEKIIVEGNTVIKCLSCHIDQM